MSATARAVLLAPVSVLDRRSRRALVSVSAVAACFALVGALVSRS